MSHFSSDGVMGVGGNDTGRHFIHTLFKTVNSEKQLSIFQGIFNKRMYLGGLEVEEVGDSMSVECDMEWNIHIEKVMLGDHVLC